MEAQVVDGKLIVGKPEGEGVGFPGISDSSGGETKVKASAPSKKGKFYRVVINQQDGPDGKFDVPLGVNGKVYLVKRGEEVLLPEDYFFVLRDSKIEQLIRNPGEEEQIITIARYSYNILGEVN